MSTTIKQIFESNNTVQPLPEISVITKDTRIKMVRSSTLSSSDFKTPELVPAKVQKAEQHATLAGYKIFTK